MISPTPPMQLQKKKLATGGRGLLGEGGKKGKSHRRPWFLRKVSHPRPKIHHSSDPKDLFNGDLFNTGDSFSTITRDSSSSQESHISQVQGHPDLQGNSHGHLKNLQEKKGQIRQKKTLQSSYAPAPTTTLARLIPHTRTCPPPTNPSNPSTKSSNPSTKSSNPYTKSSYTFKQEFHLSLSTLSLTLISHIFILNNQIVLEYNQRTGCNAAQPEKLGVERNRSRLHKIKTVDTQGGGSRLNSCETPEPGGQDSGQSDHDSTVARAHPGTWWTRCTDGEPFALLSHAQTPYISRLR